VLEKHGKLRGKLGEEMAKAIVFYLEHHEVKGELNENKRIRNKTVYRDT
jgi:hypothetical protein